MTLNHWDAHVLKLGNMDLGCEKRSIERRNTFVTGKSLLIFLYISGGSVYFASCSKNKFFHTDVSNRLKGNASSSSPLLLLLLLLSPPACVTEDSYGQYAQVDIPDAAFPFTSVFSHYCVFG